MIHKRYPKSYVSSANNDNDNDNEYDNDTNLSFESLPPGWIEGRDPISGNTFYYDERTGESAWTLPAKAFDASCDNCWEGGTSIATAGVEVGLASSPEGEKMECRGVVPSIEKEGCKERDVAMTKALSKNAMEASLPFHGEAASVDGTSGPNASDDVNHDHAEEIFVSNKPGRQDTINDAEESDGPGATTTNSMLPEGWMELVDPGL
mmetsp:Transcript_16946/g.35147  ORF Transcript_16946/g.35147 Transcript_16946/m.35147 type:complete len:207 (+) Transcript_16946:242-862(+)